METRIVRKTGHRVSDKVYFEALSEIPITEDEAVKAQADLGYHPGGYSFCSFKAGIKDSSGYVATWYCWANCD